MDLVRGLPEPAQVCPPAPDVYQLVPSTKYVIDRQEESMFCVEKFCRIDMSSYIRIKHQFVFVKTDFKKKRNR